MYAIDANARYFEDNLTQEEQEKKKEYFVQKAGMEMVWREMEMNALYTKMYEAEDRHKWDHTLLEHLLYMNHSERIRISHGHYLIGSFKIGEGRDYYGADNAMGWYNRNVRIFQNLLQINEPGEDRIFLLIGAGHVPIIDFLVDCSIDFEKKHFKDFVEE